jgi:hypothetical protein
MDVQGTRWPRQEAWKSRFEDIYMLTSEGGDFIQVVRNVRVRVQMSVRKYIVA